MQQVQAQVDVWKQLGKYGTGMYQVSNQDLPAQTGKSQIGIILNLVRETHTRMHIKYNFSHFWFAAATRETRRLRCVRPIEASPADALRKVSIPWPLLPQESLKTTEK